MKKRVERDILGEHHHKYKFLRWFEWFTDLIIPYLLIILAVELLTDNPFWTLYSLEHFEPFVTWFDHFILFFFLVDLTFKWFHVRNMVKFVKLYWLDILAVLPFYLGFRVYARFAGIALAGEELVEAQKIAHEAVLARETRLIEEAAKLAKEEAILRESKPVIRALQSVERSLRFASGRQDIAHEGMKHAILSSEHS